MSTWTDITARMEEDARDTFGQSLTMTRGLVSVPFVGILDLDAMTKPVGPADFSTEGVQPRLDVRIVDLFPLGRPQHGDLVTTEDGQTFEVSVVENGSQGCVSCWLLETTEVTP